MRLLKCILMFCLVAASAAEPRNDQSSTTSTMPDTTPATPGTTATVPGTTATVPGTTATVPGTTATVPGTTATVPGTTATVPGTTATVPGTTATVPGTTATVPGTTATVPGTTATVPGTTATVPGTTATVPGTTATVPGTTATVPGTTATVPGTTATVPGTTATVPGTTATVPGTTATVPGTTATVPGTTATVPGTTATVPGTTATTTSGTPGTTFNTTIATTATTTKGPCTPNPCVGNGICEERHGLNFVCICRSGLVYDNKTGCNLAKVFPGDLVLTENFQDEMSDKTSVLFRETTERIQDQLYAVLQDNPGYLYSVVLSLKPGSIIAEVQNFYDVSSDATTQSVVELIDQGIADGKIANATFKKKSVCDIGFCDDTTTDCKGDGTAVCTCRDGYIKSQFSTQSCISCPSGEKAVDLETCEKCSFGFSGLNCNDPYLLVVVVVSCVFGSLLIIFAVALIVVSSRKQKVNSSQSKEEFSNVEMSKPVGVPRIPRVNPTSDWQPANLEVTNSGSTEALVIKSQRDNKARYTTYDGDSDDGYRTHDPPVYGGVRGVENGLKGNQNPYYRQDEDRIRRY